MVDYDLNPHFLPLPLLGVNAMTAGARQGEGWEFLGDGGAFRPHLPNPPPPLRHAPFMVTAEVSGEGDGGEVDRPW
jgi:hypothetical protein